MSNRDHTAFSIERLPIVGVMGSGKKPHRTRSRILGQWLAQKGVHLLCGGGGGVMSAVSQAFAECSGRVGKVIGIIPGRCDASGYSNASGYPNAWVEIPIFTHLPLSGTSGTTIESRNHINVLTSDVLVILPGSAGTASEAKLAVTYKKPAIAWLRGSGELEGLPPEVPVQDDFSEIKDFVNSSIEKPHG